MTIRTDASGAPGGAGSAPEPKFVREKDTGLVWEVGGPSLYGASWVTLVRSFTDCEFRQVRQSFLESNFEPVGATPLPAVSPQPKNGEDDQTRVEPLKAGVDRQDLPQSSNELSPSLTECEGCGCSRWACEAYRMAGKVCCPDCNHGKTQRPADWREIKRQVRRRVARQAGILADVVVNRKTITQSQKDEVVALLRVCEKELIDAS